MFQTGEATVFSYIWMKWQDILDSGHLLGEAPSPAAARVHPKKPKKVAKRTESVKERHEASRNSYTQKALKHSRNNRKLLNAKMHQKNR